MPNQVSRSNWRVPRIRDCSKQWPRAAVVLLVTCGLLTTARGAENSAGMGLLNLTSVPITQIYASPAGQNTFSSDQIPMNPEGEIDRNKILRLTGFAPGRYVLRITDNSGRVCWARNVDLQVNKVVSLQDEDLTDCDP
jgi:hypothetical protein